MATANVIGTTLTRERASEDILRVAPGLSPRAVETLAEMYTAEVLPGTGPDPVTLRQDVRITMLQGAQLNRLMKESGTRRSLEVGFAYGFSSVWMAEALIDRPDGLHVSIDPSEETVWGGVGLAQLARLQSRAGFRWIPDLSIFALTDLGRQGERFDFIYIDGNHRFDDVLVDFYLSDFLLSRGGLVALDDMWMPAIRSVASFVRSNRNYELLPQPAQNLVVFRKLRDDDREWRHFTPFPVHSAIGFTPAWKRLSNGLVGRARRSLAAIGR